MFMLPQFAHKRKGKPVDHCIIFKNFTEPYGFFLWVMYNRIW